MFIQKATLTGSILTETNFPILKRVDVPNYWDVDSRFNGLDFSCALTRDSAHSVFGSDRDSDTEAPARKILCGYRLGGEFGDVGFEQQYGKCKKPCIVALSNVGTTYIGVQFCAECGQYFERGSGVAEV